MSNFVKQILFEAKQVGILYHFTTLTALPKIVRFNRLGEGYGVSFTRNKNFDKYTTIIPKEVKLTIDGNKLSNNYKLKPYQWNASHLLSLNKTFEEGKIEDQFEELCEKDITFLSNYLIKIEISEWELENIIFDDDFLEEIAISMNCNPTEISLNDYVRFVMKICKNTLLA